ncbi:MAG: class I SAM-dependent methyltransferase [Bacteroidales bacterium]
MIPLLTPVHFTDYELIDSGNFYKLERFGRYILSRPEPQAIWKKHLSETEWQQLAHAHFVMKRNNNRVDNLDRGEWLTQKNMPESWYVQYQYEHMHLKFRLALTSFKHVGLFPEQAENWNFIYDCIKKSKVADFKVLNLFAYTGGASLAARAAGARVTHVDAVKQVITWANDNMQASHLADIRWIVDDALKFVRREVKRGNKYNGIILDPPAYGRGPEGEKWVLEQSIAELMELCHKIFEPQPAAFVLLNLYSMGYSPLIAQNLLTSFFQPPTPIECGELCVADRAGRKLPLGIFGRFCIGE